MCFVDALNRAFKGDEDGILFILERFKPTLKKFSIDLKYDEAETDLIIGLLEVFRKSECCKMKLLTDGDAVNYIYKILRNKRNDLFRKRKNKLDEVFMTHDILETLHQNKDFTESYVLTELLNCIQPREKEVIKLRYIQGYSDREIACILGVSRQAVCKLRKCALLNLRKLIEMSENNI